MDIQTYLTENGVLGFYEKPFIKPFIKIVNMNTRKVLCGSPQPGGNEIPNDVDLP